MKSQDAESKHHVLIAGGGITGLESLMAVRDLAGGGVRITLAAPDPDFVYKPLIVEEPFSAQPTEQHALAPIAEEFDAEFIQKSVTGVHPEQRSTELSDGSALSYDKLIVCIGARQRPAFDDAVTLPVDGAPLGIDALLGEASTAETQRMAFVIPPGRTWPLPVYELALLARRRSIELGLGEVESWLVTPEEAPLINFGPAASNAVSALLEARGIHVQAGARVKELKDGGLILVPGDERLEVGRVVALPLLEGPALKGLPSDSAGFLPIDDHARVRGTDDVFAAGDGTNFPIKHGGLGTQQADAAAEQIAADLGRAADPQPFHPVIRGKLLTGDESLHMQHDVAGGGGGGTASPDYLWWPPQKVSGRYLAPWLGHESSQLDEPPQHSIDVEVGLPKEWHEQPMALDPDQTPPAPD